MNEAYDKTIREPRYPEVWPGWETVEELGQGSFGAVYKVRREMLGYEEYAAVKRISIPQSTAEIRTLRESGYDDESITANFREQSEKFMQEYIFMRSLSGHANIVNCDDIRTVPHGDGIGTNLYIKMELLTPLSAALTAEVDEKSIVKLGVDLCRALELCEQYKIIHRDIKPANIFVSKNGDYKLGDFGVSRIMQSSTTEGTVTGTPRYMAPEVYGNQPYNRTADIYSLGLVLYWLLNERRTPFQPLPPARLSYKGDTEALSRRMKGEAIPEPKNGSGALKKIVLKAVAYERSERYQSAAEMKRALEALLQPQAADAPVAEVKEQPEMPETPVAETADGTRTVFEPRQPEKKPEPEKDVHSVLSERMEAALSASDWQGADSAAQELLKLDSRNARAYLVRFLCAVECRELEEYSRKLLTDTEEAEYEQRTDSFEELRAPVLGRLASYGSEARNALGKELPPATYPSCVRSRREQRQQAEKRLSDQYLKWAGTCDPGVKEDIERLRTYTLSVMDSRLKQAETEEYGAMLEAKTEFRKALSAWEADYTEKHRQTEAPKPVTYTPEPPKAPAGPVGESHASAPADSGKKKGTPLWLWVLILGAIVVGVYYWYITAAPRETSVKKTSTNAVFTYAPNDSGITITGYNSKAPAELILPGEIDGNRVTRIGNHAFSYCHSLKSVAIPEGVTNIYASAFYNCESLTSVTIPDSVTSIGAYAFDGCSSLTSVTIPDGCECGKDAFPSTCTVTRRSAEAAQAIIANTVLTYTPNDSGISITGYEGELPAELTLPGEIDGEKVTAIGNHAFSYCHSLKSVAISDSVKSIDDSAFYGCYNLTSVTIPDGVTSIGSYAFSDCCSLKSVTISDGVTSIGNCAFSDCESLTNMNIPDSVTIIGIYAFDGCESLTSVSIPANCKIVKSSFPSSCTVTRR